MQQKIEFKRERDFSGVFNDSLKFIKQNFKSLFGSIILIIGPFILIMGVAYAYMQVTMSTGLFLGRLGGASPFNTTYFISIGVLVFSSLLTHILLSSVVYNHMGLYHEKAIGEKITVSEVSKRVWSNLGTLIGSMFTFFILMAIIFIVIAFIIVGIVSATGIAGGVIIGLLVICGMIIYIPVLAYFIPASFYVVVRDDLFIFSALKKVRKYLSGNFWWTWLIMVVALIALSILNMLFSLPASIMSMMKIFSRISQPDIASTTNDVSILLMVFYTLGMFFTTCASSISNVISAFNFMSHEEQHEGKGLLSRIDEIN